MKPTEEQALQFAIMLNAGLPASDAICYFADSSDPKIVLETLGEWQRDPSVKKAMSKLLRKPWQEMTLEERIDLALEQHYNSLAYLLFSRSYIEAGASEKSKLDTARTSLEAKKAGNAGKGDALSRFFEDLNAGRLKKADGSSIHMAAAH